MWVSLSSRMGALEKPSEGWAVLEPLGAQGTPVKKANFCFCRNKRKALCSWLPASSGMRLLAAQGAHLG